MNLEKINKIDKIESDKPRYDIEVEDNHNYYANGMLVHNCRCYITKDGAFSRNGKQWVATKFIEESLVDFFKANPDAILDGELYNDELNADFNKIISLAKRVKNFTEQHWDDVYYNLEFHIFDIYYPKNIEAIKRYKLLKQIFGGDRKENYHNIVVVDSFLTTKDEFHKYYQEFMEDGYEGIMLRDPDSLYECKRSYGLQKYKEFLDSEHIIVDIIEGAGNRSGMFGRAILKNERGVTFEANARGNEEYYKELLNNKDKYIGKMATIRYQNETPDDGKGGGGVPRFGVLIAIRDYEN